MPKKICVDGFVYLQKAPITASSENMPESQYSAYRRKYYRYHLFKQNVFSARIRKNIRLNLILLNFWNHSKILQDLHGQNLDWFNIWAIIVIFMDLNICWVLFVLNPMVCHIFWQQQPWKQNPYPKPQNFIPLNISASTAYNLDYMY